MFFASCTKCKECKTSTSQDFVYSGQFNDDYTQADFDDEYPTTTVTVNMGEVFGDDLKAIDGKTQTSSIAFDDEVAITQNITYKCD